MIYNNKLLKGIFLGCLSCILIALDAQDEARVVTDVYIFKNVNVVQKPGTLLSATDIIVRDGLIHSIGTDLAIPFDAQVIDADSMFIYAGFIDAASHTGIPNKEESTERPKDLKPGNPPNHLAGITPDKKAIDMISSKERSVKEMRDHGFTISHVVPRGRMLPGKGAIIVNRNGTKGEIALNEESSMYATLKGAQRMYPVTIIGIMAKWRDLYHNAKYQSNYANKYATNPIGMKRPIMDDATTAMVDVVNGNLPVFFKADKALDIQRVIRLKEDLGFNIVLTDVDQVFPVIELIKEKNIPLVLSISLPKEEKKTKEVKKDETKTVEKSDAEKEGLEKRKMESIQNYLSQAGKLEKNGVNFAFSFIDGKLKDFKKNVNRMIEAGLTEESALKAMTSTPAALIGIDKVAGTIEVGKMANLVITDKSYFDEKSNIRFVLVDGHLHRYEIKEKKNVSDEGAPAVLEGKWLYEIEIPGQTRSGSIVIEENEDEYKIKFSSSEDPDNFLDAENVELLSNNLSFEGTIDNDGFAMHLSFDLEVDGESFEGTIIAGQFGSFPITGEKIASPEK